MRPTIEQVLQTHTPELMAIPGVVGTGQGERAGRPIILVLVAQVTPELQRRVPKELGGYPVAIRETGHVRAIERR